MRSVEDAVRAQRAEWPDGVTPQRVFGTAAPAEIAALVDDWCAEQLGERTASCELFAVSVGCVFGLRLRGGSAVVVKAFQPRFSPEYLRAVQRCQRWLHEDGVPCPRPRAEPAGIGGGVAVAETRETDTGQWPRLRDDDLVNARRASANGLAAIVRSLAPADEATRSALAEHPLEKRTDGLYPEPHSPDFDFSLDIAGAAWIDELAHRAVAIRDTDTSRKVVGHADWSARNVRLGPDPDHPERVTMAFDWDSLAVLPETALVGQAAQVWCATGEADRPYPTVDDVAAFVQEYERARGMPFTAADRRSIGAAALWLLCYSARCEHAIERRWPDHPPPTAARRRLRERGDHLISDRSPLLR